MDSGERSLSGGGKLEDSHNRLVLFYYQRKITPNSYHTKNSDCEVYLNQLSACDEDLGRPFFFQNTRYLPVHCCVSLIHC